MRANQLVVVLDACVLAPMPVADTILRLAEGPCLFVPKWSPRILEELRRTLEKFGFNPRQIERRIHTMNDVFPDSLVRGYEGLIPTMTNDTKDRHVVAAAVKCGARVIVSDNQRHFPVAAGRMGWNARQPTDFLPINIVSVPRHSVVYSESRQPMSNLACRS